jgi:hypothetical protein
LCGEEKTKKAAVNPEDGLQPRVNKSLNPLMRWITLPLLLAAAAPLPKPVVAQVHVIASVEIVAGEEVRFGDMRKVDLRSTLSQKRIRDGMPMIEFY